MCDQAAARQWLATVYGGAPGLIHICGTGEWTGATFETTTGGIDRASDYAATLSASGREGVYARVTTVNPGPGAATGARGGADASHALVALWADVDIAGPGHADTNLPPDEDTARAVVSSSGLPEPSVWVHSGGGLYPYWLLEHPALICADNRDDLTLMASWLQRIIGASAATLGWHYGTGVGDLSRVLRLPGTINRKAGLTRPCRIVGGTGERHPLDTLYRLTLDHRAAREPEPPPDPVVSVRSTPPRADGDVSPGDDYAARVDWADVLTPHGWRLAYTRGPVRYWRRPGKRGPGISATTDALGTDRLRVFTTSTRFEAASYSKLGALAVLEHDGDFHATARALADAGYGSTPDRRTAMAEILGKPLPRYGVGRERQTVTVELPDPVPSFVAGALDDDAEDSGPPSGHPSTPPTPPPAPDPDPGAVNEATMAAIRYREEVIAEARRQRIRADAAARNAQEDYERTWREPASTLTLAQELELPDDPITYRIDCLLPAGGNALLTAQFKAGKTTLCNDLLRCLADGEPFLGRFDVTPLDGGRVAIFNYEMSPGQFRRWLRDIGVANPDRICVLNLRGYRLPPNHPQVESWIIKWLTDREVSAWVVDPFARAFVGAGDENSNGDVGAFLDTLDVIKERAGVAELVLPVHTGRAEMEPGQERARGATRLDDWADTRWLLTCDDQGRRFFRAAGRDVDVPEELLTHDPATRRLTLGGWDRLGMRRIDLAEQVVAWVTANPGHGTNEIIAGMGRQRNATCNALQSAVHARRIMVVSGPRNQRLHYPIGHPIGSTPVTVEGP